jgi:hypothetical protein
MLQPLRFISNSRAYHWVDLAMKKAAHARKTVPVDRSTQAPPQSVRGWGRTLLFLAIAIAVAASTFALFEYVIWAKIPPALVGKWVVEGGDQDGATFDFSRNGKMLGRINVANNTHWINARVRVEDDFLITTTWHPQTGQENTTKQTIRTLDDQTLNLVDQRGQILRLVRAD